MGFDEGLNVGTIPSFPFPFIYCLNFECILQFSCFGVGRGAHTQILLGFSVPAGTGQRKQNKQRQKNEHHRPFTIYVIFIYQNRRTKNEASAKMTFYSNEHFTHLSAGIFMFWCLNCGGAHQFNIINFVNKFSYFADKWTNFWVVYIYFELFRIDHIGGNLCDLPYDGLYICRQPDPL